MFRGNADPNTMRFLATLSTRLRPVLSPSRRTAAALLLFALAAGVRAQMTAPSDPVPAVAPSVKHDAVLNWNTGEGKSYAVPAFEVPGYLAALNVFDRISNPHDVYDTTLHSAWEHLHQEHWVFDKDAFNMNQFSHPYGGSMTFGFARSTGGSFWQSLIYSNAGSFIWEIAGETDLPSINDQITTGTAGALLGESLFRMSSLLLEGGGEHPGFWRELGAAVLSPPTGFNRLMFGGRFKAVFPSHDPALFMRLRWGVSTDLFKTNNLLLNEGSAYTDRKHSEAILDFSFSYGLPGKTGYTYNRPFDYFKFEFAAQTSAHGHNFIQDVMVGGLLYGTDYEVGENYRGIWGLYGSYDYIAPAIFRVSSPPSRSERPNSGGSRATWPCRDRPWPASASAPPAPFRGPTACAITTMVRRPRGCSPFASSSAAGPCSISRRVTITSVGRAPTTAPDRSRFFAVKSA